jgi:hypothetical protein
MGLSFTVAAGSRHAIILRPESRGTRSRIVLSQIRDSPNLEGQVPLFLSHRKRVAQLTLRHWVAYFPFTGYWVSDTTWTAYKTGSHRTDYKDFCLLEYETVLLATCFMLVSCLAYSSTVKMKATCSSERSVEFQRSTPRYPPEYVTAL